MAPDTRRSGPSRTRVRRSLRTLAIVGVIGALLFGDLTGARADTPTDPAADPAARVATANAAAAATSTTVTLTPKPVACGKGLCKAALPIITCRVSVTTPFVFGTSAIWADGTVVCNYPVDEIYLAVLLMWDEIPPVGPEPHIAGQDSHVVYDAEGLNVFVEAGCAEGFWQTRAQGWIVPPPGYNPPVQYFQKLSNEVVFNIDANCQYIPPPPVPPPPPTTTTTTTTTTTRPRPMPPPCPPNLPNCQVP